MEIGVTRFIAFVHILYPLPNKLCPIGSSQQWKYARHRQALLILNVWKVIWCYIVASFIKSKRAKACFRICQAESQETKPSFSFYQTGINKLQQSFTASLIFYAVIKNHKAYFKILAIFSQRFFYSKIDCCTGWRSGGHCPSLWTLATNTRGIFQCRHLLCSSPLEAFGHLYSSF